MSTRQFQTDRREALRKQLVELPTLAGADDPRRQNLRKQRLSAAEIKNPACRLMAAQRPIPESPGVSYLEPPRRLSALLPWDRSALLPKAPTRLEFSELRQSRP
jgi:hypothetical protein